MTEKLLLRLTLEEKLLSEQIIHLDPNQKVQKLFVKLPDHDQSLNSKQDKKQNPQPPEEHQQKEQIQDEQNIPIILPFYSVTNLDKDQNIIALILYRIFLAIYATKNFVHSYEYYRTTEVAYHIVHGDVPLDDEWKSIHPTLNTLYQLYLSQSISFLDYYGFYEAQTIRAGIYISHAVLLIIGDISFYKLVKLSEGPLIARITIYIYFSMKSYNMCVIRCFNESIITILSIMTLYCFMKLQNKLNRYHIFLWFLIILQMFQRVTTIFTWIPLILHQIIQRKKNCNYFVIGLFYGGLSSLILNIMVDTKLYEQFTVTIFNQLFFHDIKKTIDVNLTSLFSYIYVHLPKSFNILYIPLVLQFAITLVDIVLERKFNKITLFAITQFILQVLQTNQNEFIVISTLPFLMVIIARLFYYGFQGKYRFYFKILFIAAILYEIVLHLSFVMFSNRKQDAVQYIIENDDRPFNIYHGNISEVPFYTITHKVAYKKIIRTINAAYPPGGRFEGETMKIEDTNEKQWQCQVLVNTIQQGIDAPKYIILNHFEKDPDQQDQIQQSYVKDEAIVDQMQDCIDILEQQGGYQLEAIFGTLPRYWQDLFAQIHFIDIEKFLRIQAQPVYVFKIKDYD